MHIKIIEHDPNWANVYLIEKQLLKEILQDDWINSFHIGSTSVPGLQAKPIINILLVVNSIVNLDHYTVEFESLGYEVMGEFGIKNRRYFRKGGQDRTHHIHAFQYDNVKEIERHLLFRDYLRLHPDICKSYGILKSDLAKQHPNNIEAYGNGKNAFVKNIEKKALLWHWNKR